jgi:Ni,Fe-hydrogenase III large subunit
VTTIDQIGPSGWRTAIERALADGARFGGAWASERDGHLQWRALIVSPQTLRVISCDAPDRSVQSIVDLVEAAGWDEREAHDLYRLRFAGHEPLRALVTHTDDPALWMTPVSGDGVHQIAVGPIHAGVIESGHFRFHVIGERILAMDPRLFYKHRGLQRAAEGRHPDQARAYVQRACAACAVANTLAYAHAIEDALGLRPDRELRNARTVLLELERVYNHLHDISAICAGVGYAPGTMAFAALKDRAQQINMRSFGHRFLFDTVRLGGGGEAQLDATAAGATLGDLREQRVDSASAWRELEFTSSLQARLDGIGVLGADDARRLGAVGPAARAAGIREDARSTSPRLAYDGFTPAWIRDPAGDVGSRLRLRAIELESTYDILEELLAKPFTGGATTTAGAASTLGIGRVESPRGATICVVELDGTRVDRLHLRTGSYANWPALAHATADNLLPDFPLINKSFELCYACVDR